MITVVCGGEDAKWIDIKNNDIEIYPKDTRSDPDMTLRSALEFEQMVISLVICPIFYENLLLIFLRH